MGMCSWGSGSFASRLPKKAAQLISAEVMGRGSLRCVEMHFSPPPEPDPAAAQACSFTNLPKIFAYMFIFSSR